MLTCNKKGVTVYFVVIVLFLLLGVSLGLGMIITTQIRNIVTAGDSVIAIAAADAGMEDALFSFYQGYQLDTYSTGYNCQSNGVGCGDQLSSGKQQSYQIGENNRSQYTFKFSVRQDPIKSDNKIAEIYSVGYYPFDSNMRAKRVLYARW